MDENTAMTPEMDAAIDTLWDDETADIPETVEEAGPGEEPTVQADPPAAEAPPVGTEEAPADPPELFTLKNRDETRQVGRDELIAMAQKGWDYDAVRAERDQLRAYRDEADPAMSLVKAFAQRSGMTVPDYLDFCRKQELMRTGINKATADAQVSLEKQKAAMDAQLARQQAEQAAQRQAQEETERRTAARKAELQQFVKAYPDVKADSIPKEVWADVHNGTPLLTAYTMHQNRMLQSELAAAKQAAENRARTPGSMQTVGDPKADPYDEGWYDD